MKPLNGAVTTVGSSAPSSTSVSSFERNPIPSTMVPTQAEPAYEPYRPPIMSHERINPFDKNKTPSYDNKTSGIYSSLPSNTPAASIIKDENILRDTKITETYSAPLVEQTAAPVPFTVSSGFDYSYKPLPLPVYPLPLSTETINQPEPKPSEDISAERRHKFERKMSDADIIFGSKPEPYNSSYKVENYSRNRSNSSFTSASTESDYVYGTKEVRKEISFQKSLSVSSDKDGDFSHDPTVLATRTFQGINNDAFSDFDSPKTTAGTKPWSNNDDDDDYDLK